LDELGILALFARHCPAQSIILEIGTFDGRTTINMAINAPSDCVIYTLDLPAGNDTAFDVDARETQYIEKAESGARFKNNEKYAPYRGGITQLLGDSGSFDFSAYYGACSLIFVDGSHTYDYAKSDTLQAMQMVKPGGVILWHDYGIWEGVTEALDELEATHQWGLQHIRGTSLVMWRKGVMA